jgi:DNA-binding LacI/PurR family transcriptional regulator
MALTQRERLRIRARSGVAEETLARFLSGRERVREASAVRIVEAAKAEGIELEPVPAGPSDRDRTGSSR